MSTDSTAAVSGAGLSGRPLLVIDPGMHTASVLAAADAHGLWAATGSHDKTVRIWSLADGSLLRTIRLPAAPGNIGKVYAIAMSPNGALVAVGGWTRASDSDPQEQIYLFDRATGAMVCRIEGLRDGLSCLAFSPDGKRLAAMVASGGGLRVYASERDWAEIACDSAYSYNDNSFGAAFAADGSLATASLDGQIRLYGSDLKGNLRPARVTVLPHRPFGIAFSPDGTSLAIGYTHLAAIQLLDGRTLLPSGRPDLSGIHGPSLGVVAWSADGQTLFAGGRYQDVDGCPVLSWNGAGTGARSVLRAGQSTVVSLVPLPDGDLLVAAADPWLARLRPESGTRWARGPQQADFRGMLDHLATSENGATVDFAYEASGGAPARFDLAKFALSLDPPLDGRTAAPRRDSLPVEWFETSTPRLGELRLALDPHETSRCLAIHPSDDRFILGTGWWLRVFDANGTPIFRLAVPDDVWAVNVTGDGRLIVAAYGDGTIRWHRMDNGVELLAFMPLADRTNWITWTPEGFYAATAGAHGILRWHINRGWNAPADSIPIEDIPGSYRPAAMPLVLQELETPRALGLADMVQHSKQIMIRTKSRLPPGVTLHLLAIGISAYNEDYAKTLRLNYAHRDALDLASAIFNTQRSLYAEVKPQVLPNEHANKTGILRALTTMRAAMEAGRSKNDLAVVHFSGHGALIDRELFLLPYEVDARDWVGIKSSALSISDFRRELLELAQHGRVLVLLDACHSGATTMSGTSLVMDSTALRGALTAANVTVLTSSRGSQVSRENATWQHGAFTKVLLDAFSDPAADPDNNGLISMNSLADYIYTRVCSLTAHAQTPEMEIRYGDTVFAVAI